MLNSDISSELRQLTDTNFRDEIERQPGVALVDFGAAWCPPCQAMAPIVALIATEFSGRATVAAIDIDAEARTAASYNVRSFPTFLFFRDGQVVDRIVGAVPKSVLSLRLATLLDDVTSPAHASKP